MEDNILKIAALSKEEALKESNRCLTELYNNINPKELDIPILEFVMTNSFGNGTYWAKAKNELEMEELKKEQLDSGVWLAITEFAAQGTGSQYIASVINAMGFTYEECYALMDGNDFCRDELEPIVNSIFHEDMECDFTEDNTVEFYIEQSPTRNKV